MSSSLRTRFSYFPCHFVIFSKKSFYWNFIRQMTFFPRNYSAISAVVHYYFFLIFDPCVIFLLIFFPFSVFYIKQLLSKSNLPKILSLAFLYELPKFFSLLKIYFFELASPFPMRNSKIFLGRDTKTLDFEIPSKEASSQKLFSLMGSRSY